MTKYPIVLIISDGKETPQNIIDNIRKLPADNAKEPLLSNDETNDFFGYVYDVETKYYKTKIFLMPYHQNLLLLPPEIKDSLDGIVIYFDAGKRNFCEKIPEYANFLKSNKLEFGLLLCDTLYDNSNEGITYKEARQASKYLDVIELGRTREKEDYDGFEDPIGYDEVTLALRTFIWSNVDTDSARNSGGMGNAESIENSSDDLSDDIDKMEEVELFDMLLSEMMKFKSVSEALPRSERLAFAESIADKLEGLIIQDEENIPDEGD